MSSKKPEVKKNEAKKKPEAKVIVARVICLVLAVSLGLVSILAMLNDF